MITNPKSTVGSLVFITVSLINSLTVWCSGLCQPSVLSLPPAIIYHERVDELVLKNMFFRNTSPVFKTSFIKWIMSDAFLSSSDSDLVFQGSEINIFAHLYAYIQYVYICIHIWTHTFVYMLYICINICAYIWIKKYIYIYLHICIYHMYIFAYIYICLCSYWGS